MNNKQKGYLFAGLTIIFWGTSASAFKIGLRYIDHYQLLLYSTFTAFVFLFLVLWGQKKLHVLKTYTRKQYFYSMFLGLLNPFLYYVVLFKAYSLLPAQIAQPLNFVWPIVLVLLSIPILKQKIGWKSFVALIISFTGVYFISSQGDLLNHRFADPLGVTLALSTSVVWALFWLFNMKDQRDEVLKLFLNFGFAFFFIFWLTMQQSSLFPKSMEGVLTAIYVGLFEMGITFVLWLKALKLAGRTDKIGNLIYLTPFCALVFIHLFLGERIYLTTIFGLILIVSGIMLQQLNKVKK
ncbi:MAG: DMT family transporter [Bacteroidales bacterium]|jgi:drug/metabolite transporter (DMT)-like permease|nr:DMT family transporter [Bacteroidales bacterium]